MPADMLNFTRKIDTPDGRSVIIQAFITKGEDENSGITWIKFYESATPSNFTHCFVDTIDPELILSALENYIRDGKGPEVAEFLKEEGRVAMSPVAFRMKLDTALGSGSLSKDAAEGLF